MAQNNSVIRYIEEQEVDCLASSPRSPSRVWSRIGPPAAAGVEHRRSKYLNNRAENSHQPTRQRERSMRKFRSPGGAQRFLNQLSGVQRVGCSHSGTQEYIDSTD
jgi:transposase-like protein